jgi:hypothetical protein
MDMSRMGWGDERGLVKTSGQGGEVSASELYTKKFTGHAGEEGKGRKRRRQISPRMANRITRQVSFNSSRNPPPLSRPLLASLSSNIP